jgi:hypothetical protein
LTKTTSADSAGSAQQEKVSPPVAKVKPQVPARPGAGSKIANLRGNFMNDLNQKLGLGPPKEKEPEPAVEDAKPLEDARKGRARGPQRRAPAKSPAAAAPSSGFAITSPRSLWTIDDEDELIVDSSAAPQTSSKVEDAPAVVGLSDDKAEQIENSTPADAPLPSIIRTTGDASTEAANIVDDVAEPTLATPGEEKSNPLSHQPSGEEVELSKETTANSSQASGPALEREEPDPDTDAIPASKQTTASAHEESSPLEKMPTREAAPTEDPRSTKLPEGEPGQASAREV